MTSLAKAYQIITIKRKFRVFIIVLDVVHGSSFTLPAVSLAPLALVLIAAEYRSTLTFPHFARVKIFHSFVCISARVEARALCRLKKIFEKVVLSHWCKLRVPTSPHRCPPCVGTAACIAAEAADKVMGLGLLPWLQRLELHQRFQGYGPCEIAASPLCHLRADRSPHGDIPVYTDRRSKAEAAERLRIP